MVEQEKFNTTLESGEISEREKTWSRIALEVEHITDKLGQGVDEQVKETLVALKANEFGTTASCEGHLDRGLPYPWVDVESILAENDANLVSRYSDLKNKYRLERKGKLEMNPQEKEEYGNMTKRQIEENQKTYEKFSLLIDEFYETSKNTDESSKLIINKGPWNQSRLQTAEGRGIGKENREKHENYLSKLSAEEKAGKLEAYQHEMKRFTKFLKEKFFSQS